MVLDGAIPASEGRLWILGQTMPKQTVWGWEIPRYSLFRVDADGLLDSSFKPLELPEYNYYSIAERRGGGGRLVGLYSYGEWLWPSSTHRSYGIGLYDAGGLLVRSHGVSLPRGVPLVVAEEADGALLCNEVVTELDAGLAEQQKNVLIRIRPDGEADPAFCVPLGSDSPHVLPDGRVDPTFQTAELARVVPDAPNRRYALGGDLSLPHCGFGPTLIGIMKSSKQLGGWGVLGFLFMAGGARGFSNPEMNPFPANDWAERRKTAPGRKRFERD